MNPKEAQSKFKQADALFKAGKHAEALAILDKLRQSFPKEKNVLYAFALCLQAVGRRGEALVAVGQLQALGDPRAEKLLADLASAPRTTDVAQRGVTKAPRGRRTIRIVSLLIGLAAIACLAAYFWLPRTPPIPAQQVPGQAQRQDPLPKTHQPAAQNFADPVAVPAVANESAQNAAPPKDGEFNLDREVQRIEAEIQQGKGVPPVLDKWNPNWKYWQRESYQPIIDAARRALENGEQSVVSDLPENPWGKSSLRIAYISNNRPGSLDDRVWGDNEDIVYMAGDVVFAEEQTLTILPGTLVLVTALHREGRGGHMPETTKRQLADAWTEIAAHRKFVTDLEGKMPLEYLPQFLHLGTLMARGSEQAPIVVCSDAKAPTPYDFDFFKFDRGVLDYAILENCTTADGVSNESVISRSVITDHLFSGLNGIGFRMANYFGVTAGEGIDVRNMNEPYRLIIKYCVFDGAHNNAITATSIKDAGQTVIIEWNTFRNNRSACIGGTLAPATTTNVSIHSNNFLEPIGWATIAHDTQDTQNGRGVDASGNFWGTTSPRKLSSILRQPL